jgi:hypothetical protein
MFFQVTLPRNQGFMFANKPAAMLSRLIATRRVTPCHSSYVVNLRSRAAQVPTSSVDGKEKQKQTPWPVVRK